MIESFTFTGEVDPLELYGLGCGVRVDGDQTITVYGSPDACKAARELLLPTTTTEDQKAVSDA